MTHDAYVSVVAVSRNDDHGGNMLRRMQIFVNAWIEQCRRHDLASELVLVEWNPPRGRTRLAEVLRWPADLGRCDVRIVTVPEATHHRYRHSESLPLFQMIAKNVGIRRARAPFVLVTNVDILFNDELFSFLSSKRLEKGRLYRIDRSDAMADVPLDAGVVEQLEYCRTHLLRVNQREATFPAHVGRSTPPFQAEILDHGLRLGEELGLDSRPTGEAYLSAGSEATLIVQRSSLRSRVLRMVVEAGPALRRGVLRFHVRDDQGRSLATLPFRSGERVFVPIPDTNQAELALRISVERSDRRQCGPQLLHFRLFEWGWASPEELRRECVGPDSDTVKPCAVTSRDIYEYQQGISLHDGWGSRDWSSDGQLFRRASDRTTFSSYRATRFPGRLVLDMEADARCALDVLVTDGGGNPVTRWRLGAGERIASTIPDVGVGRTTFTLHVREDSVRGAVAPGSNGARVYGLRRVGWGQSIRTLQRPLTQPRIDYLHTNACGDFTLMHRDHWFHLRGYPEWEAYSMNIDGFTCYAAHADGLQEVVLREPMRIYHIEHGLGSGWSPEGEKKLYERITSRGITWISKEQVLEHARRMYLRGPLICNDEGWGLGREILPEATPAPAAPGETAVPMAPSQEGSED